ncbi:tryptophan halogenase family protein [Luteibacter aegosomatissinici]|uniref:tryptophan halogenase family protein n=1 Tax=Luteibacter aegosomatissinici TaxID=2911539 RepID=UPI001FF88DF4|nr:tryptophan halogenase family protein [Luteibacter aegosomatissinici]UPG96602.1 tryptophan 7-halogenase [Luteibacter aegosomatissinici]
MARLKKVLVVGGGTAGWLAACYLAKAVNAVDPQSVQVHLVESPDIGLLGVGEATFPSIRGTLAAIGLDERRFLVGATATYKQGIHYRHWVRPPGTPGASHFFHPFNPPSQRPGGPELLPYWLLGAAPPGMSFAEAVSMQTTLVEHSRAPKRARDAEYQGPMNHAFHFDAACFARVLAEHGQETLGVVRHVATVERTELDEHGAIARVVTKEEGDLTADLYVDCTGLRSLLIGNVMQSPFRSRADVLFSDRAVAMQVPYEAADTPIPSYTISTAQEAGWIWDIGLQKRRGVGYVYSSRHTDTDRAEAVFRQYLGKAGADAKALHIKFETGYRPEHWRKNCVGVGLAGGFVEPLESTGIALIELATYLLTHLLPGDTDDMEGAAKHFNEMMVARYDRIIDFIKMHYCLSQRRDSAFWADNCDPASIPASLQDKLAKWKRRPPHRLDFVTDFEMFMPSSWQYVLYGMEFKTDLEPMRSAYPHMEAARLEFAMIQQAAARALGDLPDHRELVEQLCGEHASRLTSIKSRAVATS